MKFRIALVLAMLVAGCLYLGRGVPDSMAGNISVRFVNASVGKICGLYARTPEVPSGKDTERGWVGAPIEKGATTDFRIRPGTYSFRVSICNDFGSRLSTARPLRIEVPTEIVVGDERVMARTPGLRREKASFIAETCASAGYNCGDGEPCCANLACIPDESGYGGVCRP